MSEVVNHPGTTNTLDAAADRLEGLMGASEEVEEVQEESTDEVEESEALEETTDEVEESIEADETDAEPLEDDEEQAAIESLSDLAETLEVPLEELLGQLKHTIQVDGERLDVTLSELQAGYQKDSDYRQKTETLKRDREQFEAVQAQRMQQFESEHAQAADILFSREQELQGQLDSVEMQQLRSTDQNAYLLRRYEIEDQLKKSQSQRQQAAQRYAQASQGLQQQNAQQSAERLAKEAELRNAAIPDWSDEKGVAIGQYLGSALGYTPEEIAGVADHRHIVMAHKAMLYDQQMKAATSTVKKVKRKPALVKPSKPKGIRKDVVQQAKGRLKKSGNLRDAATVIENLL